VEFTDHVGTPLQEALLLVHNTLVGANLRDKIKIGASGKIITAFDIARTLALGADWCNSARGFMFALGCIQSQSCHTDRCPTGVATQDKARQRALVVPDKIQRVANFHENTLKALAQLIAAAGLTHPSQLRPRHLVRRISPNQVKLASALLPYLDPGLLLDPGQLACLPPVVGMYWPMAQAECFDPYCGFPHRHSGASRNPCCASLPPARLLDAFYGFRLTPECRGSALHAQLDDALHWRGGVAGGGRRAVAGAATGAAIAAARFCVKQFSQFILVVAAPAQRVDDLAA
jgi:hypothetical protein